MRYYYVAQTQGRKVQKIATEKTRLDLNDCYRAIGCQWVEMLSFITARKAYTMVIDEEGKLTGQPISGAATLLYANPYDCIAGKAVIVKTSGWATFTEEQATVFDKALADKDITVEVIA